MTTDTTAPVHHGHAPDEHDHPRDTTYWKVGGILGVITALEVSTYFVTDDPYSHDLKPILIGGLFVMMTAKFATIGAYFMHLRFDKPVFRQVFIAGLVLALAVYLVVMTTFTFFDSGYESGLGLVR